MNNDCQSFRTQLKFVFAAAPDVVLDNCSGTKLKFAIAEFDV